MIHTFHTHLAKKRQLTETVYIFGFKIDSSERLEFKPGQYLILIVPTGQSIPTRRLFSIITTGDTQDYFEILIEYVPGGPASEYLKKVSEKDLVVFQGPAGVFHLHEKMETSPTYFVATGTGIAPVYAMIEASLRSAVIRQKTCLFFGLKTYQSVYLFDELKELAKTHPNFSFKICLSRENSPDTIPTADRQYFILGRVTKELNLLPPSTLNLPHFYVCGNKDVVESLRNFLYEKGAPKENVIYEKFT